MIKIYILRHEEAVTAREVGGLDRDRVLTTAGEQNTGDSARGMVRLGIKPDRIWTSPYLRAAQTARLTAKEMGLADKVEEVKELSPGADPKELAGLIEDKVGEGSVMLVGHNPDFETLIAWLISPRGEANIDLKKGALALIHADPPIKQGSGSLRWLLIPSQMGQARE